MKAKTFTPALLLPIVLASFLCPAPQALALDKTAKGPVSQHSGDKKEKTFGDKTSVGFSGDLSKDMPDFSKDLEAKDLGGSDIIGGKMRPVKDNQKMRRNRMMKQSSGSSKGQDSQTP